LGFIVINKALAYFIKIGVVMLSKFFLDYLIVIGDLQL